MKLSNHIIGLSKSSHLSQSLIPFNYLLYCKKEAFMCTHENPDHAVAWAPPLLWPIIWNGLWSGVINCQLSLDSDVSVHLGKMSSGMLSIAHVLCTKQSLHWLITARLPPSSVNNDSIPLAFIFCPCVSVKPASLLFVIITLRGLSSDGRNIVAQVATNSNLSIRLNQERLLPTA